MDAYPEDYVVNNLPFILLSGLDATTEDDLEPKQAEFPLLREKGLRIYSDFPPLSGPTAKELRDVLVEEDASAAPWEPPEDLNTDSSQISYKIKSVGRVRRSMRVCGNCLAPWCC